jgi:hypothetical protein
VTTAATTIEFDQRIYHDAAHPSAVILPIIPRER